MSIPAPALDHRRLGRDLGLFASDDVLGSGLPLWLPAGAVIRDELARFVTSLERRAGYHHVHTPPLAKRSLYERSGHWDHYQDAMFPSMELGGDELVLRPMNCPHHMRVFAVAERSYRDLPFRLAELGAMFRNERSGVVGGLSRVRGMTLNDGHVFCSPDQVEGEVVAMIADMRTAHEVLGIDVHRYRLSLRGEGDKFADDDRAWRDAEAVLRRALTNAGIDVEAEEGEAAFYGPKLDVQVVDAAGREETLSTIQVDMVLPQRLGITYVGADGRPHPPVVVHRSLISTFERMVAYLVERYQGDFPLWLAPMQVQVLPVSDEWHDAADAVVRRLRDADLRAALVDARQTLNARIRLASVEHVPYVAVVGAREAGDGTVSLRDRSGQATAVGVEDLVARLEAEVRTRSRAG